MTIQDIFIIATISLVISLVVVPILRFAFFFIMKLFSWRNGCPHTGGRLFKKRADGKQDIICTDCDTKIGEK